MDDDAHREHRTRIRERSLLYAQTGYAIDLARRDSEIRDYAAAGGSVEEIAALARLTPEEVRRIAGS